MYQLLHWVLVSKNPVSGHWRDQNNNFTQPHIGTEIDPSACDEHWEAALSTLGFVALAIPDEPLNLRVTSKYSATRAPLKIRGF